MGMPVTVAMGNAYYVFFVPMVIATRMPMPIVTGMPVTMCTGTSTIGKHAPRTVVHQIVGPQGPTVHISGEDNWALVPQCLGLNLPGTS